MKTFSVLCLLGLLTLSALADDKIAEVQQLLKNGGYYFGEISGQKDADTSAAIRRYQIRNGLDISGELTDATYKSIRSNTSNESPSPAVVSRPSPQPTEASEPSQREESEVEAGPDTGDQPRAPVYQAPRQDRQLTAPLQGEQVPAMRGGFFAGTPYDNAPPEVQQDLVIRAQKRLAKSEMFRGSLNGVVSPELEFSLRAYQSRVGLQPSGRLDLQTLAALELLPGADQPVYMPPPRRAYRGRPGVEPPVRGEWIRP